MTRILTGTAPHERALIIAAFCVSAIACGRSRYDAAPAPPTPAHSEAAAAAAKDKERARAALVEQGKATYARICAVCHGPGGEGYKADQAPALYHPEFLTTVSDPFLAEAIKNGRRGSTMSAWSVHRGGPLSDADVDAVIAFLRNLQQLPSQTLDNPPPHGDAGRGSALYSHECARCHGEHGTEGPNLRIGDMMLQAGLGTGAMRRAIAKGRSGTPMAAFEQSLGEQGIEDVLTFLTTLPAAAMRAAELHPPPPAVIPPPLPLGPVPLNPKGPEPHDFKPFPDATKVEVVYTELARGARMAFLDARAPSDYANEHIAGAVSVPFYDPSPYLAKLPKNAWLVCYCACPHAESGELAQKLMDHGFKKVTVLAEGLGYWKVKKYGTHTGPEP
jgi:cytochrome c oxidase cbb3-type subunit 3/ubiquinol-cytochrome c reductase cytochrome c subunit